MSASDFFHLLRLHVSAPLVQRRLLRCPGTRPLFAACDAVGEQGTDPTFNQEQGEWLGTRECPSKVDCRSIAEFAGRARGCFAAGFIWFSHRLKRPHGLVN